MRKTLSLARELLLLNQKQIQTRHMAKKKATPETEETKKKKKNVVYKDINRKKGELSYKSIKELCAETGRTEASIRGEIQVRGIDRKGDITIRRYKRIKELKKKGWTLWKICQDKELCGLFNKPEGKTVSVNTVRKYLSEDFNLSDYVDFRKVSTYSEFQRGKAADCLLSLGYSQDILLENILMLYVKDNHYDCDLTYSKGNFYKTIPAPQWKFDKFPQENERGERPLPLDDVDKYIKAGTLNSVVVDLPFIVKKLGEDEVDTAQITQRFTCFPTFEALKEANESIIATARRLLHDDGVLVLKTQDSNSSAKQIWTHSLVEDIAEKNGFFMEDLFICINGDENGDPRFLPLRKLYAQQHARKVHTYFYVFKKINREELDKDYESAIDKLEQHHTEEAIEDLTTLAKRGYRKAMLTLGRIYYMGKGVDTDTYNAIYWLRKAAELGSYVACRNLGNIYYNMANNEENNRFAWQYYSVAAWLKKENEFYLGKMLLEHRIFNVETIWSEIKDDNERIDLSRYHFADALEEKDPISGLYLWKAQMVFGLPQEAESYYKEGEELLQTPIDYNNWAYALCEWGEYDMAFPYIEKCLSLAGNKNLRPSFLDTYAEILYGLGRLEESKEVFNQCLAKYTEKDERRGIYETKEKIRKKFAE